MTDPWSWLIQNLYRFLTNDLGIPVATILGLSLIGVLVGSYWLLTSREVELFVEEVKGKEK